MCILNLMQDIFVRSEAVTQLSPASTGPTAESLWQMSGFWTMVMNVTVIKEPLEYSYCLF